MIYGDPRRKYKLESITINEMSMKRLSIEKSWFLPIKRDQIAEKYSCSFDSTTYNQRHFYAIVYLRTLYLENVTAVCTAAVFEFK